MEYPRLPENLDLRKKITEKMKFDIFSFREAGLTYKEIKEQIENIYSVKLSIQSIRYWLVSEEERKELAKNINEKRKERFKNDLESLEKSKESTKNSIARKRVIMPEIKQYDSAIAKTYYYKNREEIIKKQLVRYYNKKLHVQNI
jgi:uncharacterized protein (UPF0210 family)